MISVPGVMERFSAEVISSNAVNLSWSSVALIDIKDIKSYRVYYNDSASKGTTRTREISPMEVSLMYDMRYYATIRGLQPDTKYSFTATALNLDDVAGPMSESIACSTFKAGKFNSLWILSKADYLIPFYQIYHGSIQDMV